MKHRVLVLGKLHEQGLSLLRNACEVGVTEDSSRQALLEEAAGLTGLVVFLTPIDREIMEAARDLKVIGRHGVGLDNIDLEAATDQGIVVVYTPDTLTVSVAEHTIAALGALAKQIAFLDKSVRRGDWRARHEYRPMELDGKTLGLIGLGRIGGMVARKAQAAYDMRVIAHGPRLKPENLEGTGITACAALEDLLRQADVVSLHVPLTAETRGLIGPAQIAVMKPTAFLLNFARGGVVDERALHEALKEGRIAGAALDTLEREPPPPDHPLFGLDNILFSPHNGAMSREAVARTASCVAQGVLDVLDGRMPRYIANPKVLERGDKGSRGGAPS